MKAGTDCWDARRNPRWPGSPLPTTGVATNGTTPTRPDASAITLDPLLTFKVCCQVEIRLALSYGAHYT